MPKLGVEMETARLERWLVSDGEAVQAGDAIATLETDKVVYDLEAPESGVIRLLVEPGHDHAVGDRLALVGPDSDVLRGHDGTGGGHEVGPKPVEDRAARRDALAVRRRGGEPLASPLARRIAARHAVDLATVVGSGPRGAIRRRDVEQALATGEGDAPAQARRRAAGGGIALGESIAAGAMVPEPNAVEAERRPLSGMRRAIATAMHASLRDTAQVTDVREHDVTALVALRAEAVARAEALGYRLSLTALIVRAAGLALVDVPELNATLEDDALVVHRQRRIGIAVAVDDGLVVPIVTDPERLALRELEQQLAALLPRARARRLTAAETRGATFTISNFGSYGSHFGTPVLTRGQVGMLGVGAAIARPVVRDGDVVPGTTLHTSVTYDHRAVDGVVAGRFQSALGALLTDPQRLVLA